MYTISLDRLTKRYGPVLAVDGLSVDVGPGRVPGFLGPNGSGKTTTLRMRLGLVAPDSGTATINGVRYRDRRTRYAPPGRRNQDRKDECGIWNQQLSDLSARRWHAGPADRPPSCSLWPPRHIRSWPPPRALR